MRSLSVILALVALGHVCSGVELDTKISTFLDDHSQAYLNHMKNHFELSLDYLFTGNAFSDQSFERPGMGKVLRGESDRHWELGIGALKKYLQRGGATPDLTTSYNAVMQTDPAMQETFRMSFDFTGKVTLQSTSKTSPDFPGTYLATLEDLVDDCKNTANALNDLQKAAMHRRSHDADMAHFLEEKVEEEVGIMRKFKNMHTTLDKMKDLGLARHFFDQHL